MARREDYGLDAPGVVRTLALIGTALILAGIAERHVTIPPGWPDIDLAQFAIGPFVAVAVMTASSRWGKQWVMRRLLAERHWRGTEAVLDIGCGRGLVAIGVARRLGPGGTVTGIDLWSARDLSANSPAAAERNARAAGVADRVRFDTGDMRRLPHSDGAFDVVASMTAIHNIDDADGRRQAVAEAWRVTRPGGQLLIYDIRHARTYARQLRDLGAAVTVKGPILLWAVLGWRFSAVKPR